MASGGRGQGGKKKTAWTPLPINPLGYAPAVFASDSREQGVTVKAEQVYLDFTRAKISRGEYLDAMDVFEAMPREINLEYIEHYKTLKIKNKFINANIDAYMSSRGVFFYSEIEQSIIKTFRNFFKGENFMSMSSLGVGNLKKNKKIFQHFGDLSAAAPNALTLNEILAFFVEFIFQVNKFKRPDNFWKSEEANIDFKNFLSNEKRVPRGRLIGVVIDVKSMYFPANAFRFFNKNMIDSRNEACNLFVDRVRKSIKTNLRFPDSTSLIDDCQLIVSKEKKKVQQLFRKLMASLRPFSEFSSQMFHLYSEWFNPGEALLLNSVDAMRTFLSSFGSDGSSFAAITHVELKSSLPGGLARCATLSVVCLLKFIVESHSSDDTTSSAEGIDATIRSALHKQLFDGIPDGIKSIITVFLTDILGIRGVFDVDIGNDATPRGTIDYSAVDAYVFGIISGSMEGGIYRIGARNFFGILTAIVLCSRVWATEKPMNSSQSDCVSTLSKVKDLVAVRKLAISSGNIVLACIAALEDVERSMVSDSSVPAFDCLGCGSFLSLLAQPSEDLTSGFCESWDRDIREFYEQSAVSVGMEKAVSDVVRDVSLEWGTAIATAVGLLEDEVSTADSTCGVDFFNALFHLENSVRDEMQVTSSFECLVGTSFVGVLREVFASDDHTRMRLLALLAISPPCVSTCDDAMTSDAAADEPCIIASNPMFSKLVLSHAVTQLYHRSRNINTVLPEPDAVLLLTQMYGASASVASEIINDVHRNLSSDKHLTSAIILDSSLDLSLSRQPQVPPSVESEVISQLLALIVEAPFGCSCCDFCMWDDLFDQRLPSYPSLLDVLLVHDGELLSRCPRTFFLRISGSSDCIPLPLQTPASFSNTLLEALQSNSRNYILVAAYFLAALELNLTYSADKDSSISGSIGLQMFRDAIHVCALQLFEQNGIDALDKLLIIALEVSSCLPRRLGMCCIFKEWLQIISRVSKNTSNSLCKHALEFATSSTNAMHTASDRTRWFRILLAIGSICAISEFPFLEQMSRDYVSGGSLDKIHYSTVIQASLASEQMTETLSNNSPSSVPTVVAYRKFDLPEVDLLKQFQSEYSSENADRKIAIQKLHEIKVSTKSLDLLDSLTKLSRELYASDVHFVMELIQNADDNIYADGVIPSVKFELYQHALLVFNNEIGFSLKNVMAICSVGASTKKGIAGFIGQKGIGFKSVFSVAEKPEIHSGGYHVQFDRSVNMLEPLWINDESPTLWPIASDSDCVSYETCLRLPFDNKTLKNRPILTERLYDVFDDKLLLFLNKLERMKLEDKTSDSVIEHRKQVLTERWTRLSTKSFNFNSSRLSTQHKSREMNSDIFWLTKQVRLENIDPLRNGVRVDQTVLAIAFKFKAAYSVVDDVGSDNEVDSAECAATNTDLVLDFSEGNFPVYAFLPTVTPAFKFVIQGDFLLPTNRECILEGDKWNEYLFDRIPDLFVDAISEMLTTINFADSTETCSSFLNLSSVGYSAKISERNILDLLPSLSSSPQVYKSVVKSIYDRLQHVRLLRCRSSNMRSPSELFAVHHLSFDVAALVGEDLLFACFEKYFLLSSNDYYDFDDELTDALGLQKFTVDDVVKCLELFSNDLMQRLEQGQETRRNALKTIGSLFLCMQLMTLQPLSAAAPVFIRSVVPAQVTKRRLESAITPKGNKAQSGLSRDLIARLKRMPIWPTSKQNFVALDKTEVLLTKTETSNIDNRMQSCLNTFADELVFLDDELFECMFDDGAIAKRFQAELKGMQLFLLSKFGLDNGSLLQGNSTGRQTGAIQKLSAEMVTSHVILPRYQRLLAESDEENAVCTTISREFAAASLAFLFLSEKRGEKRTYEAPVPLLRAHDKQRAIYWRDSTCVHPSRLKGAEVHLGVEFKDSATRALVNQPLESVLRQLGWCVVDPLVGAYVIGLPDLIRKLKEPKDISSQDIMSYFNSYTIDEQLQRLRGFYRRIGVVDFYGFYSQKQTIDQAPELFRFLNHVKRNSKSVSTSVAMVVPDNADDSESDTGEVSRSHESDLFVPVFLPRADVDTQQLLWVSDEVHKSLAIVLWLIRLEAQNHLQPSVPEYIEVLNRTPWFPISVHPSVKMTGASATRSNGRSFLACPCHVIVSNDSVERNPYLLGPHAAYIPKDNLHKDANISDLCKIFHFYRVSYNNECPSLLADLLDWMSQQSNVVLFFNENFLKSVYTRIFDHMKSVTHIHTSLKDTAYATMTRLIDGDFPILWVKNVSLLDEEYSCENDYYAGGMVRLSRVCSDDKTTKLCFDSSPIKVLSYHYKEVARDIALFFSREKVCSLCRAVEGMFGAHGCAWTDYTQVTLSSSHKVDVTVRCNCLFTKFGKGFEQFFPMKRGLIKTSPSAMDFVEVMRYYRGIALTAIAQIESCASPSQRLEYENTKTLAFREIREIIRILSSNIWKCFNIKLSLHPYSPSMLAELSQVFLSEPLLPSFDSLRFVKASSQSCIFVDDSDDFELFREYFESEEDLEWVGGETLDDSPIEKEYTKDIAESAESYSLHMLTHDVAALLTTSPQDFNQRVNFLNPLTFFASKTAGSLMKLLGVPDLSLSVFKTVLADVLPASEVTIDLTANLNRLLKVSQLFLKKSSVNLMIEKTRLQRFLNLEIFESSPLSRVFTLKRGAVDVEKHKEVPFIFQHDPSTESFKLYLNRSISIEERQSLAVSLVHTAVRIDVSLQTLTKNDELMEALRLLLDKFSKCDVLFFEKLLVFDSLVDPTIGVGSEAEGLSNSGYWRLTRVDCVISLSSTADTVSMMKTEDIVDNAILSDEARDAMRGYDESILSSKKWRSQQAMKQVPSNASSKQPESESLEYQQFLLQNQHRDAALSQSLLGGVTVVDTPTPDEAGSAPQFVIEYNVVKKSNGAAPVHQSREVDDNSFATHIDRVFVEGGVSRGENHSTTENVEFINVGSASSATEAPGGRRIGGAGGDNERTGVGSFDSSFNRAGGPNKSDGIYSLSLPEKFVNIERGLSDDEIESEYTPLSANASSGRIGETIAYEVLCQDFLSDSKGILSMNIPDDWKCTEVIWHNEVTEKGLPFDIEINFETESRSFSMHCEVKTKRPPAHLTRANQFAISASEVMHANDKGSDFFCILVSLPINPDTSTSFLSDLTVIGFGTGLIQSLHTDSAQLLLQVK